MVSETSDDKDDATAIIYWFAAEGKFAGGITDRIELPFKVS